MDEQTRNSYEKYFNSRMANIEKADVKANFPNRSMSHHVHTSSWVYTKQFREEWLKQAKAKGLYSNLFEEWDAPIIRHIEELFGLPVYDFHSPFYFRHSAGGNIWTKNHIVYNKR